MLAGRQSGSAGHNWDSCPILNAGSRYSGVLTLARLSVQRAYVPRNNARHTRCTSFSTSPDKSPRIIAKGSAWWLTGSLLTAGGAAPNLFLGHEWSTVVALQPAQIAVLLLGVDGFFILTANTFLSIGGLFGEQRYGKDVQPYPGPFVEEEGVSLPALFEVYILLVGLLTVGGPIIALGRLILQDQAALGISTLGVYSVELLTQLRSETTFREKGSVMWPNVPQVYQTYRIWQLIRGCALTTALHGPEWLWLLQAALILYWYFNFGAVLTWMPWLYRWQLQPRPESPSKAESQ